MWHDHELKTYSLYNLELGRGGDYQKSSGFTTLYSVILSSILGEGKGTWGKETILGGKMPRCPPPAMPLRTTKNLGYILLVKKIPPPYIKIHTAVAEKTLQDLKWSGCNIKVKMCDFYRGGFFDQEYSSFHSPSSRTSNNLIILLTN